MNQNDLYPELREYIFQYCGKYFWRKQNLKDFKLDTIVNSDYSNIAMYKVLTGGGPILENKKISDLTNDGFEGYKNKMSEIIFNECKNELELNLCPKCSKITRTPWAKQCRFCFHDWH
jgi:hypothetical protein